VSPALRLAALAYRAIVSLRAQGFEDLTRRQCDLAGDFNGTKVIKIHLVVAQLVGDAQLIELSCGIRLQFSMAKTACPDGVKSASQRVVNRFLNRA